MPSFDQKEASMLKKWSFTAVVALAALVDTHGAAAQGRGVPGGVVFNSARDGNNEIYVMNWDGSGPLRVAEHPASDTDPAISPNGRDIIFTSNRNGNNDIFIIDSTGRNPVNLTDHPANDGWSRWSPNGRQIVFHSNRDGGNFEIYVMNIDGSSPTRITEYPGVDQFPDWSPDGREIVFRRDVDIYAIDVTSGETRRLTQTAPLLNQMAVWSPNGRELAFMSARDGYPSVFVMNADGSGQTNLTPKAPGDLDSQWISRAPSWSTTGRQIFFMSSRPSTGLDTEIFLMASDGTGLARITHVIGVDGSPRAR
jgi:Tol biopolymer transport system component